MRIKEIPLPSDIGIQEDFCPDSSRGLSLRRHFLWTLAGNMVYAACQWGMLLVLAKLGTPEMVGQFALGLAITAPIFMFSNLQLRAVQATDARQEYLFGHYLALRLLTVILAFHPPARSLVDASAPEIITHFCPAACACGSPPTPPIPAIWNGP